MNADEKNALRNEATASVASMGPNAKAMLLSSDILRYLDKIDHLEARIAKLIETADTLRARVEFYLSHISASEVSPCPGRKPRATCLAYQRLREALASDPAKPSLSTPNQEM
jgi:hypothetical protein